MELALQIYTIVALIITILVLAASKMEPDQFAEIEFVAVLTFIFLWPIILPVIVLRKLFSVK